MNNKKLSLILLIGLSATANLFPVIDSPFSDHSNAVQKALENATKVTLDAAKPVLDAVKPAIVAATPAIDSQELVYILQESLKKMTTENDNLKKA